ncbi:hypothetical protein DPMN_121456 [Dreissena polymorpha]|uniref:Uncharacterized protein n=1 Tax=Dreissena polymorpha TaxID=45954 RepID=A0A9D4GMS4_DREPO|nr:hypothetical protein DPMN_121453 [Dreissena polymorpha]KAH3819713.1 hypothetical protein DPMN_121456 [Dreissena polymorpha]
MHNCQGMCAKYFKPTGYLFSGLFEVAHPRYGSIVSTQQDRLTEQVMVKGLKGMNSSKKFFPCNAVVQFVSIETFTVISNDYFATFLKLRKHSSRTSVRCVCV